MLKLNASYSKKVPAEAEYSSQSFHASSVPETGDIGEENPQYFYELIDVPPAQCIGQTGAISADDIVGFAGVGVQQIGIKAAYRYSRDCCRRFSPQHRFIVAHRHL